MAALRCGAAPPLLPLLPGCGIYPRTPPRCASGGCDALRAQYGGLALSQRWHSVPIPFCFTLLLPPPPPPSLIFLLYAGKPCQLGEAGRAESVRRLQIKRAEEEERKEFGAAVDARSSTRLLGPHVR